MQGMSTMKKMNDFEILTLKKPGITDFAAERNELLAKTKSDWVLFLDTDEKATPGLLREITDTIAKRSGVDGYYIRRKIYFLNKYVGQDKVLRLAKKNAGKWKRAVHEIWDVGQNTGYLKNFIIHNTADNLHSYIDKINCYSDLHARENIKEGKKVAIWKIILYPIAKFFQNIFYGRGFVFSMLQSFHSFLGWTKQWELEK